MSERVACAWFAGAKTGCKFWENDPSPGETITWAGNCVNGIAEGPGTLEILVKGKPSQDLLRQLDQRLLREARATDLRRHHQGRLRLQVIAAQR